MTQQQEQEEICECSHPFPEHVLVSYDDPANGGLIFCPECTSCVKTWSVSTDARDHVLPPPHVVAEYRKAAEDSGAFS